MADLYHIFIRPRLGVQQAEIEKKLNLALDWFRYTDECYIVYTLKNSVTWYTRLKPLVENGGNLLILNIDPDEYKGWMPKEIWPWLLDKKKKIYGNP